MHSPWKFELFGHLQLQSGDLIHTRFYSQKVAALLARLAYFPHRQFGREEIIELFWPDSDLRAGRVNLRTALTSLRRQLEPPGTPFGSILCVDYSHIYLNPTAFTTDVARFEAALKDLKDLQDLQDLKEAGRCAVAEQRAAWQRAYRLYRGELLPGFYEDWVLSERDRLALQYRRVTARLRDDAAQQGDLSAALDYAWRLAGEDPLAEEAQLPLIELLVRTGQRQIARQQYERLYTLCHDRLGEPPSAEAVSSAQRWNLVDPATPDRTFKTRHGRAVSTTRPAQRAAAPDPVSVAQTLSPREAELPELDLPLTLTRFFGRDRELRALCEHLRSPHVRLLTLTGIGGIGKTRLAIEAARAYAAEFAGRIAFVALADLPASDLLPAHLLRAFGLNGSGDNGPVAQLAQALQATPTLLLLDNFEHLVAGSADFVAALLAQTPLLRCLVTSRQSLEVVGEHVIPLEPLPTPAEAGGPQELMRWPSVQLLVDRAQAIRPDFQLTPRNAKALAAVCNHLEGIPLALELAAARVQVVTMAQMRIELQHRFDFLVARRRNVAPRHRSLRATLDWSYQSLLPEQQRFLMSLAAFRGGWTVEAARAVCEEPQALSRLEELNACSLVIAEEGEEGIRFRLLETVREYCTEKLAEAGAVSALQRRHWRYYTDLVARLAPLLRNGPDHGRWRAQIETEYDNLRAALHWCRDTGADEQGVQLAGALAYFWLTVGHTEEGRDWLDYFLLRTADGTPTPDMLHALHGAGTLAAALSEIDAACDLFARALTMARELSDRPALALILNHHAFVLFRRGDYAAALAGYEESLQCYRGLGKIAGTAYSLAGMARVRMHQGDLQTSATLFAEGISLCRNAGLTATLAATLTDQGALYVHQNDYLAARRSYEEAVALHRGLGNRREVAYTLSGLGAACDGLEAWAEAEAALQESLTLFRALGDRYGMASDLTQLAHLHYRQSRYAMAEELGREALTLWKGQHLAARETVIVCLEVLAYAAARRGRQQHAFRLLACTHTLRARTELAFAQAERERREQEERLIRSSLTDAQRISCWEEGAAMSWDQAADYALYQL